MMSWTLYIAGLAMLGMIFIVFLAAIFSSRKKTKRNNDTCQEPPFIEEVPEDVSREWVDLIAFPMDFRSLQPWQAQIVSPHFGHNKRFLQQDEACRALDEKGIIFRVVRAEKSMASALKIQVCWDDLERARELLKKMDIW